MTLQELWGSPLKFPAEVVEKLCPCDKLDMSYIDDIRYAGSVIREAIPRISSDWKIILSEKLLKHHYPEFEDFLCIIMNTPIPNELERKHNIWDLFLDSLRREYNLYGCRQKEILCEVLYNASHNLKEKAWEALKGHGLTKQDLEEILLKVTGSWQEVVLRELKTRELFL